jgi:pyruvate kinase
VAQAISSACCDIAEQIKARAIVSATMSGYTATQIARHRPPTPVMAVSPLESTQRKLSLVWGVECVLVPDFTNTDGMLEQTAAAMLRYNLNPGDKLVITAGVPFGLAGHTNLIQVHEIH